LPITLISFAHYAIKKKLQKLPSWRPQKEKSICTSITKKVTSKRSSGSEEKVLEALQIIETSLTNSLK